MWEALKEEERKTEEGVERELRGRREEERQSWKTVCDRRRESRYEKE